MEAHRLREVDRDYRAHLLAYLIVAARATRKAGKYAEKPVYDTFRKFYDYDEALRKAKITTTREHDHRFDGISNTGLIKKKGE